MQEDSGFMLFFEMDHGAWLKTFGVRRKIGRWVFGNPIRVERGRARCRFHGGLSTGPKIAGGRARIAEAQRRRWREYRPKSKRNAGPVLTGS
jgi:hypothetical protein